jgi:hypothetical protein
MSELMDFTKVPQKSQEQLAKEKKSMDKFLYEKDVEDFIIKIKGFKKNINCKKTFLQDLDKMIQFYERNQCKSAPAERDSYFRGGGNKYRYKKLKRKSNKTKKNKTKKNKTISQSAE